MATFVLVHGAWTGAHGWRHVRAGLWREGHPAFTPALTGVGEKAHLTGPGVGLRTHVLDVVNTLLYEDLRDVVLVGFSYGGMVVSGALEHVADRVRELVFLDAFVPHDGQSVFDLMGRREPAAAPGAPWEVPALPRRMTGPDDQAWSDARRVPQPMRTFSDPVHLRRPLEEYPLGLTYVKATGDPDEAPDSAFWQAAGRARNSPRWRYLELDGDHMLPSNRHADVADLLISVAAEPGAPR